MRPKSRIPYSELGIWQATDLAVEIPMTPWTKKLPFEKVLYFALAFVAVGAIVIKRGG
jgi:hypothetical protein